MMKKHADGGLGQSNTSTMKAHDAESIHSLDLITPGVKEQPHHIR